MPRNHDLRPSILLVACHQPIPATELWPNSVSRRFSTHALVAIDFGLDAATLASALNTRVTPGLSGYSVAPSVQLRDLAIRKRVDLVA